VCVCVCVCMCVRACVYVCWLFTPRWVVVVVVDDDDVNLDVVVMVVVSIPIRFDCWGVIDSNVIHVRPRTRDQIERH
jgi:hypothetical protein